ncbi:VOC family protein [Methylobrevis pamukkalensis]|uniref:Glyoxalase-like domain protein n=1 Tax=Methylobrevis pamukkalensis TaxID=1439726 RepID=A0A1E3H895_9HYPH|nr:VOC family protein [Methylobrevis pamukkalensis]ODN72552.1 Glyoxalase-like domain protein [Methylobrevis pamukkalensis]
MTQTMPRPAIMPALLYRDPRAAVEFLARAFGFEPRLVAADGDGGIAHAELVLGGAMVMVGPARDEGFGAFVGVPAEVGKATAGIYVVVADPDAVHATAVAAGAEILLPLTDQDYGGRDFTCRDPEGQIWSFGSYDPWGA